MENNRNIGVTLECFVKKDGKYLVLRRADTKRIMPGVWMGPGGHREFGEGLFAAARREILEETGLTIKNLSIRATGVAYLKDLNQELFFDFVTADYAGGKLHQDPSDGELVWLPSQEILQLDTLLAELKFVLPHVFSDDPRVVSYRAVYKKGNDMSEFCIEDF